MMFSGQTRRPLVNHRPPLVDPAMMERGPIDAAMERGFVPPGMMGASAAGRAIGNALPNVNHLPQNEEMPGLSVNPDNALPAEAMASRPQGMFGSPRQAVADPRLAGAPIIGPDGAPGGGGGALSPVPDFSGLGAQSLGRVKPKFDWARFGVDALTNFAALQGNQAAAMMIENNHRTGRDAAEANRKRLEKLYGPEQVGGSLIQRDPVTGDYNVLFRDPEPFEVYANAVGLQPGSPEYLEALQDFALKGYSDRAFGQKRELQGERLDVSMRNTDVRADTSKRNTDVMAGVSERNNQRSTTTSRENNVRSTTTSRENNQRSTGQSRENSIRSDATRRRGQDLRSRARGRRVGGVPVNPSEPMIQLEDGRTAVVRGGKWVPVS